MLGVFIPASGGRNLFNTIAVAVPLAIEAINANTSLTGGLALGYVFGDDPGCSSQAALSSMVQLFASTDHLNAVIGPVRNCVLFFSFFLRQIFWVDIGYI